MRVRFMTDLDFRAVDPWGAGCSSRRANGVHRRATSKVKAYDLRRFRLLSSDIVPGADVLSCFNSLLGKRAVLNVDEGRPGLPHGCQGKSRNPIRSVRRYSTGALAR